MSIKTCKICKKNKRGKAFPIKHGISEGLICRKCINKRAREYYKTPEGKL